MNLDDANPARENEEKEEGRLQQYKNLTKHEELRRRRTECSIEIRKKKGTDLMMKRRNIHEDVEEESDTDLEEKASESSRLSNDDIKKILSSNPTLDDMIQCFETLRKLLSKTKNPPINDVIQAGLLNALVTALGIQNDRIQYEAAWAITNIVSGTSAQTIAAVEAGATEPLVKLTVHPDPQIAEQAMWAVANIAGDSAQLRDYVIRCHGVDALMHLMEQPEKLKTTHARTVAWAFSNMCRHKNPPPPLSVLRALAGGLKKLLLYPDRQVRQDACWAVSYLTDGPDEQIEVARESGILSEVVPFLDECDALIAPALRTLGNVATGTDSLTQTVIELGVLQKIGPLMERTRLSSIMKECTWLVSNIIAGTKNQIQAVLEARLLPLIIRVLRTGDHKCRVEAAWALSNLAQGGTDRQIFAMWEENAVPALCSAMSVNDTAMLNNVLETLYTLMLTVQMNEMSKRSKYAEYFDTVGESATCKACHRVFKWNKTVGTNNIRAHLKSSHPKLLEEIESAEQEAKKLKTDKDCENRRQAILPFPVVELKQAKVLQSPISILSSIGEWESGGKKDRVATSAVMKMIALDAMPFQAVEKSGFRHLMKTICPKFHYPTKMDALTYQVEENDGLEALERLQESPSVEVYCHSYKIISEFFSDEIDGPVDDQGNLKNWQPMENGMLPLPPLEWDL